jgi:hypothetical protein
MRPEQQKIGFVPCLAQLSGIGVSDDIEPIKNHEAKGTVIFEQTEAQQCSPSSMEMQSTHDAGLQYAGL